MTVARLPKDLLWVHSPVKLTPEVRAQLDRLGTVRHLIAPCHMHDLYLRQYREAFPGAQFHGAPGMDEKLPHLGFDEVLCPTPPNSWHRIFRQTLVAGIPRQNEFVFLHQPSRSLIVADLVFNIPLRKRWLDRFFWWINGDIQGRLAPSRLYRASIEDVAAFRTSLRHILTWEFERIIVGHGQIVDSGGREKLQTAIADTVGL